jgi:cysteine desulfurase / selenocysteine lyase
MQEIEAIRKLYPALETKRFFGSAGVGPLSRPALDAMTKLPEQMRVAFAPEAWEADAREEARGLAASLVGAAPEEITLTGSTSAGLNLVAGAMAWEPGSNIVLNDLEYPANIFPWIYQAQRQDLEVRVVRSREGAVPLDELCRAIDARTQVLSVSHVEFGSGFRNDIAALAEAVHAIDGLLCVDAIQSVGALEVDVQALGADVLATGGYKWLCGPLGTGFTYIAPRWRERLEPLVLDFGHLALVERQTVWDALVAGTDYPMGQAPLPADGTRYEAEGLSPLLFKGLSAAMRVLLDFGPASVESRIVDLVDYLIEALGRAGVEILSPTDRAARSGIVTVRVPFDLTKPEEIKRLEEALRAAGIVAHARGGGLRFAVHFFNTREDLDAAVSFVAGLSNA